MPINNNHFDNFYINSVFTQNTNSGFAARCTRSLVIVSTHTQDQPGSAFPLSFSPSLCPFGLPLKIILVLWVLGGRVVEYPTQQPAGLNFNPFVLQFSLFSPHIVSFPSCRRPPCGRLWDANRVLINDNEFFIMCQLLAVHMDLARDVM